MRRRRFFGTKRTGVILAAVGAGMIIALMLPFWFWWLAIGIGFLTGGICLLRR